jgi:hypothetical protein
MASDRGNDANSLVLVVEESRLVGKLMFLCNAIAYLFAIIEWRLWNIFKSNMICK